MKTFYRSIVFTKLRLKGLYRYKDLFQVFPADLKGMPKNPYQQHYPNILEYWTTEADTIKRESEYENLNDILTETATTYTKEQKYLSLLNAFTNNRFFKYSAEGTWAIPVLIDKETNEVSEEINSLTPEWCSTAFHYPGLPDELKIAGFTVANIDPIKTTPHNHFYMHNPSLDIDLGVEFVFPQTIDLILDGYFSLDKETQLILDSAMGFNISAFEILTTHRTLALLSSFTAVETMVNLEYQNQETERCPACTQLKFSIARKFKEYLQKYIGDSSENKKKFNAYYNLRSKIVHTGMRLKSEVLFAEYPKEILDNEYVKRLEILQMGKLAIANWLIKNRKIT